MSVSGDRSTDVSALATETTLSSVNTNIADIETLITTINTNIEDVELLLSSIDGNISLQNVYLQNIDSYLAPRSLTGRYSYALVDVPSVAGANRFLTLFNPSGSGKVVKVTGWHFGAYSIAVNIAKISMRLSRISAHSVGTLVNNTTGVFMYDTNYGFSTSQLRIANPTVTQVNDGFSFNPPSTITAVGQSQSNESIYTAVRLEDEIVLNEEQGICFYISGTSDVDATFNISIQWLEQYFGV